jgi:alpha-1,4-digalacturonate transport system permease protein
VKEKKPQTYRNYLLKQKVVPYFFLMPNMLIFLLFIITPAIMGFYFSLTEFRGLGDTPQFVGLKNYIDLFTNFELFRAIWNTILLLVVTLPIVFWFAMILAIILIQPLKARGFVRAVYYWPVMISFIVVGLMWRWILRDSMGYLNGLLETLGFNRIETLLNPRFAWWSVVFIFTWSRAGYYMIMFMAALLSIPVSLYEAADMDGATRLQKFMYITYPSLKPARLMVFILAGMEIFKIYPLIETFTSGGPFANDTFTTQFAVRYIYETAFSFRQVGMASAMSVVMIIIVMSFTGINLLLAKRSGAI